MTAELQAGGLLESLGGALIEDIATHAKERCKRAPPASLLAASVAFADAEHLDPHLSAGIAPVLDAVAQAAHRTLRDFSPGNMAAIVHSLAQARSRQLLRAPALFRTAARQAARMLHKFSPVALAILLYGLARAEERDPELFEAAAFEAVS